MRRRLKRRPSSPLGTVCRGDFHVRSDRCRAIRNGFPTASLHGLSARFRGWSTESSAWQARQRRPGLRPIAQITFDGLMHLCQPNSRTAQLVRVHYTIGSREYIAATLCMNSSSLLKKHRNSRSHTPLFFMRSTTSRFVTVVDRISRIEHAYYEAPKGTRISQHSRAIASTNSCSSEIELVASRSRE